MKFWQGKQFSILIKLLHTIFQAFSDDISFYDVILSQILIYLLVNLRKQTLNMDKQHFGITVYLSLNCVWLSFSDLVHRSA